MIPDHETTVLVVGAGPVGVTLAMDLKSRGVDVLVVEQRETQVPWMSRCNAIAARSMEVFRRLGVAGKLRATGLPDDHPTDVVWVTRANGHEIARVPLASRATRFTDMTVADAGWPTPEPVHRSSQLLYDQVLHDHASQQWQVPFLMGVEFIEYTETAEAVVAVVRDVGDGRMRHVRCDYLVGCDGGSSAVRKRMGAKLAGDDMLLQSRSSLIRAPWMRDHLKGKPAWMIHFLGPGAFGVMIAVDGSDLWVIHSYLPRDGSDFDVDDGIRQMLDLPSDRAYEVVYRNDWVGRRMLADRFRKGRIFICGDACHIWPPFGGYGMNAGIADAASLSWTLASVVEGWGATAMLDVYEAERRPVTTQVSRYVAEKVTGYMEKNQQADAAANYDRDDEVGEAARAETAARLLSVNRPQYAAAGLNFAYYYDASPVIAYDGEAAPPYDMGTYTPSTAPGCRTPQFQTPDGRWLYDLLGAGYTLLRFDPSVSVSAIVAGAKHRRVPLDVLDLENPDATLFRHKLLLVRPDQYVAWRADSEPLSSLELIDLVRGARVAGEDVAIANNAPKPDKVVTSNDA